MGFYHVYHFHGKLTTLCRFSSRTLDRLQVPLIAEAKNLVWFYTLNTSFSTFAFSFKNFDEEVQRQLRMLEERAAKEDEEKKKMKKAW